jgi:hypothetical protein
MGKTLLLLGSSTEQKVEQGDPPRQTWIYRNLPEPMNMKDIQIDFVGDPEEGGFEFANSKEAKALLDKARAYYANLAQTAASSQAPAQAQAPAASPAAPQAGAPVTTPALKAALDAAAAGNAGKDIPVQAIADSFMTSTGETFATVAVDTTADVQPPKQVSAFSMAPAPPSRKLNTHLLPLLKLQDIFKHQFQLLQVNTIWQSLLQPARKRAEQRFHSQFRIMPANSP